MFDRGLHYIGGLELDERRYDTPTYRRAGDQMWHDVQLLIDGPVVAEAQQHLETILDVIEGRLAPPKARRLLRTLSRPRRASLWHFGPYPMVSELRTAHLVLPRRSENLIYMESQYFRDIDPAKALAETARVKPDLQMILILSVAHDNVAFDRKRGLDARLGETMQARALRILRRAFGSRLFVGSPAQPRPGLPDGGDDPATRRDRLHGAPLIYVHAKVSVFDDAAAIVSSSNLNGRSLRWDTEAGVYLTKQDDVIDLRHRVMAHWLPDDAASDSFEAATAVQAWTRIARRNATKPPLARDGYRLPQDFAAAEAFRRNLPIIPPEFV